jgi:hypothetical protein
MEIPRNSGSLHWQLHPKQAYTSELNLCEMQPSRNARPSPDAMAYATRRDSHSTPSRSRREMAIFRKAAS